MSFALVYDRFFLLIFKLIVTPKLVQKQLPSHEQAMDFFYFPKYHKLF